MFKLNKMLLIPIILMVLVIPNIFADFVLNPEGGCGFMTLDENGHTTWTANMNVNFETFEIQKNYEILDNETVYAKWLFGFLFIAIGMIVFFATYFKKGWDYI